jgi:hypothetical protein
MLSATPIKGAARFLRSMTMSNFSIGLGRTFVAIASTLICGSSLMMAALGPGLAQAQTAPDLHQATAAQA